MKRTWITIVFFIVSVCVSGQIRSNAQNGNMVMIAIGINSISINNPSFDAWTLANYNKTEHNNTVSVNLDITVVFNKYDAGLSGNLAYPYIITDLFFGRRITPRTGWITSYFNLKLGEFGGFYSDIIPANYVTPGNYHGNQFQLQYGSFYIGAESKNYLNFLSFKSGKGRRSVSFNSGFFAEFGYMPWSGDWEYGYYTGSGRYAQFHGTKVNGIPALNDAFIEAGIFFGIGS